MLRLLILCAIAAVAKGQTTSVQQCMSNADLPINVYLEGCLTPPCRVHQLEYAVITVIFRAPHTIRSMKSNAAASMLGLLINYDLGVNAITCNFLGNTYCPLIESEVVQYTLNMYIESFFPAGLTTNVEFSVEDENSNTVFCARLSIQIAPPL